MSEVALSLRTNRGCSQISELRTRRFSKGIGHSGKVSCIGLTCWVEDMVGTKRRVCVDLCLEPSSPIDLELSMELSRNAVMVILHRNAISQLSTLAYRNVQEHPDSDGSL